MSQSPSNAFNVFVAPSRMASPWGVKWDGVLMVYGLWLNGKQLEGTCVICG